MNHRGAARAEDALARCGGVARRPALAALGVSDAELRRAVRRRVLQPGRGVYALPTAAPADVALVTARQLLTCVSAAGFYDLWAVSFPAVPHVHHRRRDGGGAGANGRSGGADENVLVPAALHHAGLLLDPQPFRPVASLADVLVHALKCLPWTDSLVMVECAAARGDMSLEFLRQRLPGKRNGKAREVLNWVDHGAESLLETLARTYFRKVGIHVEVQVYLEGVGYVDLLLDAWLVVELDGRHHAEWRQVRKDHRRNNLSAVMGYTVLRYYYSDVVHEPEHMVAQVLAVLASRANLGPKTVR